uniref:Uncharacterized protein n=1 Tax=Anguilla anguilla TaxID=7936 RepID=A0A0E9QLC8_ANGAN
MFTFLFKLRKCT